MNFIGYINRTMRGIGACLLSLLPAILYGQEISAEEAINSGGEWTENSTNENFSIVGETHSIETWSASASNHPPTINTPSQLSVPENQSSVTTIDATDADGSEITYSILESPDRALFNLHSENGTLNFTILPNFEDP